MVISPGRVWKFGHHVDTDAIVPGRCLELSVPEAAAHALELVRPEFAGDVNTGDIIVAGANFGCGSSREQAAGVLKELGVGCVIAESFGRIFFRNAIALGLPAATCPGVWRAFEDGDIASVFLKESTVVNETSGTKLKTEVFSDEITAILEKGGILEFLKESMGGGQ